MILIMLEKFLNKRVYLDYAAATPLLPSARRAMLPFLENNFGNPSAIHTEGQVAKQAVNSAREEIARTFQVRPEYVILTSGGTESNNLAIRGLLMHIKQTEKKELTDLEIITCRTEHPATLKIVEALARRGVGVQYVQVNKEGLVDLEDLQTLLNEKTTLVTIAIANSEIGVIQKVHAIRKILDEAERKYDKHIYLHLDAAQAPLWLHCQFDSLKADLVSFDAGKCNGPKGVGLLLRSKRTVLKPVVYGGGQEDGLRPGTENVASIVGASIAFAAAQAGYKERLVKVSAVRDAGIAHIQSEIPTALLNGPEGSQRLANNINISIPGLDTEFATVVLDKHGFAVSTKSACAGAGGGESSVVREISGDSARAASTLRISLSPETTVSDLKRFTKVLKNHIEKMKSV